MAEVELFEVRTGCKEGDRLDGELGAVSEGEGFEGLLAGGEEESEDLVGEDFAMGEVEGFVLVLEEGFEEGLLLGRVFDLFEPFLKPRKAVLFLEEELPKVEGEEGADLLEQFFGGVIVELGFRGGEVFVEGVCRFCHADRLFCVAGGDPFDFIGGGFSLGLSSGVSVVEFLSDVDGLLGVEAEDGFEDVESGNGGAVSEEGLEADELGEELGAHLFLKEGAGGHASGEVFEVGKVLGHGLVILDEFFEPVDEEGAGFEGEELGDGSGVEGVVGEQEGEDGVEVIPVAVDTSFGHGVDPGDVVIDGDESVVLKDHVSGSHVSGKEEGQREEEVGEVLGVDVV